MSCHIWSHQMDYLLCGFFHVSSIVHILFWSFLVFFQVPVWALLCALKWAILLNTMLHFEQGKSFSPVWILSCFLELPFSSNILLHLEQECHWLEVFFTFETGKRLLPILLCTIVHSLHHLLEMSCHIWSRQMASLLCVFCQVFFFNYSLLLNDLSYLE